MTSKSIANQIHILFFLLAILITPINWTNHLAFAHPISPVYEEMVAREIAAIWPNIFAPKNSRNHSTLSVTGWTEADKVFAAQVAGYLEAWPHGRSRWKFADETHEGKFQGIFLITDWTRSLAQSSAFVVRYGDPGFLIVSPKSAQDYVDVVNLIEKQGLSILAQIPERDLEFIKDSKGRQVFDLDSERNLKPIYEQMVFMGGNPTQAWPSVEKIVQEFRSNKESIILIVGKRHP